jgi:hypothetical protein
MTRLGFRSLGLPLAITGTALLALTPMMTSPFIVRTRTVTAAVALRDNDALIMGGTGGCCVTPATPWGLPGPRLPGSRIWSRMTSTAPGKSSNSSPPETSPCRYLVVCFPCWDWKRC